MTLLQLKPQQWKLKVKYSTVRSGTKAAKPRLYSPVNGIIHHTFPVLLHFPQLRGGTEKKQLEKYKFTPKTITVNLFYCSVYCVCQAYRVCPKSHEIRG
jgi:hypothetical protein